MSKQKESQKLDEPLNQPWLVAVWPGMGNVAISAGFYLMSKLGMHLLAELSTEGLFDVDHVMVQDGLVRASRMPRNRFFVWRDPEAHRDIVVFIGEAQPPQGKYVFCQRLIEYARSLGVQHVFTFAAMATHMHPEHKSRVFCAATNEATLGELKRLNVEALENGHIGGLNGILLGAAADIDLPGACLLGEIPHIFAQLPFPKASLAVLRTFTSLANIEVDFDELSDQAKSMEEKLGELLAQVEQSFGQTTTEEEPSSEYSLPEDDDSRLSTEDEALIQRLFQEAAVDRAKAYELKQQLDRLEVFKEYEDRFLDLFKNP
jgi:proteasome assembly chaperone (PAC2) family protein